MDKDYDIRKVRGRIFSMLLPVTTEGILQMIAGVISMGFVGRLNPLAINVVGLSTILYMIIWSILRGIGVGASAYAAKNFGAGEYQKIRWVSKYGLIAIIAFSIALQQITYNSGQYFFEFFGDNKELIETSIIFFKTVSYSLPFAGVILYVSGLLQGMGNAKTPMFLAGILNGLNVVFSYLLIFGKFGFPNLNFLGAAYAYNISYGLVGILSIYLIIKEGRRLSIYDEGSDSKNHLSELMEIVRLGLPTSAELVFWQISAIFVSKAVLTFGDNAYAAYQLGKQAESIFIMPAQGFAVTATALIGQAIGSKEFDQANIYYKILKKYVIIVSLLTTVLLIVLSKATMRIFTNNMSLINIGALYLIIMGITQIPQNLSGFYNGVLRAGGYSSAPFITAGVGIWLIRIPLVVLISKYYNTDILWIWLIIGLDLLARYIISVLILKKRNVLKMF